MLEQHRHTSGFSLIELLVAIAIVAILAAVGIPAYMSYMVKSRMSEIVTMSDKYKSAVAECLDQNAGTAANCDGGTEGIPANITSGPGYLSTISITDGVITATPRVSGGLTASDTYILTPTWSATNGTSWTVSGGACTNSYVNC
ncbi:MAG: prepilin-type N-terminal cleavage/methylation domain-containing protein [Coxiellaceae bacterium]|nr:prepilin-type N-terminal cleavage/methylation domain-containing protein [Coxiellaceae bacterium]